MSRIELGGGSAIPLRYMNRHVLVTGATGAGKTVSTMALIERLTGAGVPVLAADYKGDLAATLPTTCHTRLFDCPTMDLARVGPDFLCRALALTEAQSAVIHRTFDLSTPHSLYDLEKAIVQTIRRGEANPGEATAGIIARRLRRLAHPPQAFGADAFDPLSTIATEADGTGVLSVWDCRRTPESLYVLTWCHLLARLYEDLPELAAVYRPVLAVVIDEAHLLFAEADPAMIALFGRFVRLFRSKGVALILATQLPGDIPPAIRSQFGTLISHGSRGDRLAIGTARVDTFGDNGEIMESRVVKISPPVAFGRPAPAYAKPHNPPACGKPHNPPPDGVAYGVAVAIVAALVGVLWRFL